MKISYPSEPKFSPQIDFLECCAKQKRRILCAPTMHCHVDDKEANFDPPVDSDPLADFVKGVPEHPRVEIAFDAVAIVAQEEPHAPKHWELAISMAPPRAARQNPKRLYDPEELPTLANERHLVEIEQITAFVVVLMAGPEDLREHLARPDLLEFVVAEDHIRCWVEKHLREDHEADLCGESLQWIGLGLLEA